MRRLVPLLAVGVALPWAVHGCARQQYPPGGGEDRIPPAVVATVPDTFGTVDPGLREIRIRFSERISERPTQGTLQEAVQVSPRTGDVRVEHGRSGLEVELLGGARPGTVYRVTVLPVVQDMFDNTMPEAFEFFFTTGPAFVPNVVAGTVIDRITGEPVNGARVDAFAVGEVAEGQAGEVESAPHTAVADSAGIFALRYLPAGLYRIEGYRDANRNAESDPFEAYASDTARVGEADTLVLALPLLEPDTTPPNLASAEAVDSTTVRLTFDDHLDPSRGLEGMRVTLAVVEGPATAAPGARTLLHAHEWEALRAEAGDTVAARPGRPGDRPRGGPPLPSREVYALLAGVMESGTTYEAGASGVTNIQGTGGGEGSAEFEYVRPEPPPETDTTAGDTAAVADTAGAAARPDTSRGAPGLELPRDAPVSDMSRGAPVPDASHARAAPILGPPRERR